MIYIYILIIILTILLYKNYNESFDDIQPSIISLSQSKMKQYNVIFGATIRNVEPYIINGLKNIDLCGSKFNNYSVVIYENDSTDNTRKLLNDNKKDNYHYIFEDNVTENRRTMRLENGRNKILNKVRELNINNEYQYMIILDLDDINNSGMFVNSIESCFNYDENTWDVLTGNQTNMYYDLWALRKKDDMEYDCWEKVRENGHTNESIHTFVQSKYKRYQPGQLLEVDSSFGGIAIYKLSSIPNSCNYIGSLPDGNETCEHVLFNKCIKSNGGKIYINTDFYTGSTVKY